MPERRTAAVHLCRSSAPVSGEPPHPPTRAAHLPACSVHLGWDGREEWGPKTSGSVTNTKHILSSSLEQSANLESSAPPQGIESKLPSPRFSCQMLAHLRLPSPSANTSVGLNGIKYSLDDQRQLQCTATSHPQAVWNGHVRSSGYTVPRPQSLGTWPRGLARPTEEGGQDMEKPRAAEVYLRPRVTLEGWPRPRGWALRFASHSIASCRTARHRILPQCALPWKRPRGLGTCTV